MSMRILPITTLTVYREEDEAEHDAECEAEEVELEHNCDPLPATRWEGEEPLKQHCRQTEGMINVGV